MKEFSSDRLEQLLSSLISCHVCNSRTTLFYHVEFFCNFLMRYSFWVQKNNLMTGQLRSTGIHHKGAFVLSCHLVVPQVVVFSPFSIFNTLKTNISHLGRTKIIPLRHNVESIHFNNMSIPHNDLWNGDST